MIVSHINNSDKYFCLHRHLKEAFAFLRTLDKSTKPQSFSFDGFSGKIYWRGLFYPLPADS